MNKKSLIAMAALMFLLGIGDSSHSVNKTISETLEPCWEVIKEIIRDTPTPVESYNYEYEVPDSELFNNEVKIILLDE